MKANQNRETILSGRGRPRAISAAEHAAKKVDCPTLDGAERFSGCDNTIRGRVIYCRVRSWLPTFAYSELAAVAKTWLDSEPQRTYLFHHENCAEVNELAERLAGFVKQVQVGGEMLLTQNHQLVAKLVPASENEAVPGAPLSIRSLKGHRVLSPVVAQAELAEALFASR